MSGFGTYLSPFCLSGVTIRPFYQIQNILNISRHFTHRDTALLSASQITVTSRVLTRHTGSKHRKRFGTYILAKLEIFIITQSHALMIPPKVAGRFTGFQRANRIFPLIDILQTVSMSNTTTGETDKARMYIG